jgi:hypothetical protein
LISRNSASPRGITLRVSIHEAERAMTSSFAASGPSRARRSRFAPHGEVEPGQRRVERAEINVCPDCRAVQQEGRWRWRDPLPGAAAVVCPACVRLRNEDPDGYLDLSGEFFRAHRDEVMALVRHVSERARLRYPLQRIMQFDEDDVQTRIAVTSRHLARSLGRALQAAFDGELVLDARSHGTPHVRWWRG